MRRLAVVIPLAVAISAGALTACSSSSGAADNPVVSSPSASNQPTSASAARSSQATGKCTYPSDGQAPARNVGTPSTTDLLAPKTLKLTLALGSAKKPAAVVIALKPSTAPCTVNAIAYLASNKYFDGTACHRLTTAQSGISVLQCGDPTGTGAGTPGFSYADELSGNESYPAGTVAMANAGANTNGSQFFLVYGDTQLDPNYTVFGTITSGLNVIKAIAAKGTDDANGAGDGHPSETVEIASATTS